MSRTITLPAFTIPENGSSSVLVAMGISGSVADLEEKVLKAIKKNSKTTADIVKIAEASLRDFSINTKDLIALALLKGQELYSGKSTNPTPPLATDEPIQTKPKSSAASLSSEVLKAVEASAEQIDDIQVTVNALAGAIDDLATDVAKTKKRVKKIAKKL